MEMLLILALAASLINADHWASNLNYASPSRRHQHLGISMSHMQRRHERRDVDQYMSADNLSFTHGVASGDPYSDSIILWTRAAPMLESDTSNVTVEGTVPLYNHDTLQYVQASSHPVCVDYEVSTSSDLSEPVSQGRAYTSSDIDYTIKIDVGGLEAFTEYFYQFSVCNSEVRSPVGRTKTTPRTDDDVTEIGIAVFSCNYYAAGFFNAIGNSARKDKVDYVIHLGDYIYENNQTTAKRPVNSDRDCFTLGDYRNRLGLTRSDEDLLLSHQNFPWIPTWDDHEVSDNGYRDGSSTLNNTEDSFDNISGGVSVDQRKMNAVRAYFEWMPIRQVDLDDNLRIWRNFSMGNLLDLIILDTRNYDRSITELFFTNNEYITEISNDASRTLMGSRQENWFYNSLIDSSKRGAAWRLIGNQVVFSRVNITSWYGSAEEPYAVDAWDGYQANRNRTLKTLYENNIDNTIFLSGDSHLNWVSDLTWLDKADYNPETGEGGVGVEFAGTAVSSPSLFANFGAAGVELFSLEECNEQSQLLLQDNEELQWQEGWYRGYYELHVTPQRLTAEYFGTPSCKTRNGYEVSLANFTVENGANCISRPVGGGSVENGALRQGRTLDSKVTVDTDTGEYFVHNYTEVTLPFEFG